MSRPQQTTNSAPFSPRQPKAISQKQYRDKEAECFNILREVIKQLTGVEPQTRYEVLTNGPVRMLSHILEMKRQEQAQVVPPASPPPPPPPPPVPTSGADPTNTTLAALEYSAQQSHSAQSWQNTLNVYYQDPSYSQQYQSDTDPTSWQAADYYYGEFGDSEDPQC